MQYLSLIIMLAALGWNAYGILQVGIENASAMQWVFTIAMLVFVLLALRRIFASDDVI